MNDGDALLKAILLQPDEDTPRLLYADWLQEHGQEERAEFIRVQVELERDYFAITKPCGGVWCVHPGCALRARERQLLQTHAREWFLIPGLSACSVWDHLRVRWYPAGDSRGESEVFAGDATRGFVESLTSTAADWLAHAEAIRAAHPVRNVKLTTEPAIQWAGLSAKLEGSDRWFSTAEMSVELARYMKGGSPFRLTDTHVLLRLRWPGVEFDL